METSYLNDISLLGEDVKCDVHPSYLTVGASPRSASRGELCPLVVQCRCSPLLLVLLSLPLLAEVEEVEVADAMMKIENLE